MGLSVKVHRKARRKRKWRLVSKEIERLMKRHASGMALQEGPLTPALSQAPLARSDSADAFDDIEEFQDALEPTMDLKKSLEDCELAIEKFFANNVKGAADVMKPWKEKSLYHSHGAAIFEFIPAMLTMDPQQIQKALSAVKDTISLCNRLRKSYTFVESLGSIVKKPNFAAFSEMQAHAELINAEALLVQACLVALEGEDLAGLIKATLKIKNSHDSYKDCVKILDKKEWEDEASRTHFESGVRMGVATFNVMISLLPPKVISVLEFVGFSGDKEHGLNELLTGARSPGLRSVLCSMTLLVHNLVIGQFAAIPPDFDLAERLINENLQKYPDSAWFLMFKGRMELLLGQPEKAVVTYERASSTSGLWPQLVHLAYWESMWAHAMMGNWKQSSEFAAKLLEQSMWSRTVYAYTCMATALHINDPIPEQSWVDGLIEAANNYRQRILGRSLPMEKFALKRCRRFKSRGRLVLPAVELLCIWNMYPSVANNQDLADQMLKQIEEMYTTIETGLEELKGLEADLRELEEHKDKDMPRPFDADDLALIRHLRGSLLSAMNYPRLALKYLELILKNKEEIKENTFLVPYTLVEVAMCHHKLGDHHLAMKLLNDARKKSGYSLESRLQFRIHSKIEAIRNYLKAPTPSEATYAGARTKLEMPATLGTQGNLVITTQPVKNPELNGDKDDKKDKKSKKDKKEKKEKKDKDKKDKKEKPKKEEPESPIPGTSKDFPIQEPIKRDTVITQDGVILSEPKKSLPLRMFPPQRGE
ncbi:tetratricopeptide repeat protein 39B-like isoform X2 [Colias croceus]|uniref:tetratricopeptide repeat protein 39B-like isoform X2 n=2 Tax=Colias crocea TaxID=72248 RepID=UPI001E27DC2F|nr:tetratricopeptide repeat protein 39B-like isoform X2 [Colias croceus]